jgi:signal transduction histidine kinase
MASWMLAGIMAARGAAAQETTQPATPLPALTNAVQIQRLPSKEAAANYPVKLRGVMTFADADARYGFIQDNTAGTVVFWTNATPPATAGDLVQLEGRTASNLYAASIVSPQFKVLGKGVFPKPLRALFDDLNSSRADCQWSELDGWVRSATTNGHFLFLSLSVQRHVIKVSVALAEPADPAAWVETHVLVRGVAIGSFNGKGQFAGAELVSPSLNQITTVETARSAPISLPVTPVEVLGHKSEPPPGSRIRVQGVVTLFLSGSRIYLRDHTRSIEVQTAQSGGIGTGDLVDVTGYYERVGGELVLEDGSGRRIKAVEQPAPVPVTEDMIDSGGYDGELVTMKAHLLEWSHGPSERTMLLRGDHNVVFTARLNNTRDLEEVPAGSTVNVTGVCSAVLDEDFNVKSFELLLRSPADLALLVRPPWWTTRRVVWIAGGLAALVCGALGWVSLLQKQVQRQTAKLQAEIEERKAIEVRVAKTHQDLVSASRQAGMAEVATSVLHNVGNVLNSVNVSCAVASERLRASKLQGLEKAAAMLMAHQNDVAEFLVNDPKGRHFPAYLTALAERLASDQTEALAELRQLAQNVEHVNEIIAMQQSYAKLSGVREPLPVADLVEDALRLDATSLQNHQVTIHRQYLATPTILIDRHKTLQILVNLIRNAKHAVADSGREDKTITLRIEAADSRTVTVTVTDNGVGVSAENLTRIFGQGFTTRKNGHGFGLHSGALAAREMGGNLAVHSDGVGRGASFTLSLPMPQESPG